MDAFVAARFRRGEGGANFRRMMSVIVNDGDAVRFAAHFEAAPDAGELFQAFANHIGLHAEFDGRRNGRCRVQDVVVAGNIQMKFAQIRRMRA